MPDLTFCLDVPVEVGLRRKAKGAGDAWNRMEQKEVDFHERVRAGYLAMAAHEPARWVVIDATRKVDEIQATLRDTLVERLRLKANQASPGGGNRMKLIMGIVNSDDADRLVNTLNKAGYRATTISTTGGFLRQGNATIFIGTEDEDVPKVLQLIKDNCHTRTQYVNPLPPVMEPGEMYIPSPVEVQVGGANVFVLEVTEFARF